MMLLCCVCVWWFVRKWRLENLTANVPTLPGALPFIGHAHHLIGNGESLWEFLQSVQTSTINSGGIMKVWMGPKLCFFVTDPKIAQTMLYTFEDKPYIYEFAKSWIDKGLVASDETAFGLKTLQKCSNEYKEAAAKIFEIFCIRFRNVFLHPSFLYNWNNTKKEEDDVVKILKKMSSDVLRTRKAELNETVTMETKKSGRSLKGFLDYLLELQSEGLLTDKEITEEVDAMIMAGSDTTARTLLFILILLASHSEAQDRVHTEIQEVLAGSCCNINKNQLSKLVYMEAVIKESLRFYSIVPIVARKVTRDYKQDDVVLPSGSVIAVMLSGINRNNHWGQDVENFNPDRWLDGSLPDFASFSFGPRACIGRNYAMMSLKTILAHFLRRYRVGRRETQIKLKVDVMLKPVLGQNISIELRE